MAESGFTITEVVSGTARGVDRLGEWWAEEHHIPLIQFPPNWESYGKGAGMVRNKEMAYYADALIAVWDGKSKGTKHMVDVMISLGKPVSLYITDLQGEQDQDRSS